MNGTSLPLGWWIINYSHTMWDGWSKFLDSTTSTNQPTWWKPLTNSSSVNHRLSVPANRKMSLHRSLKSRKIPNLIQSCMSSSSESLALIPSMTKANSSADYIGNIQFQSSGTLTKIRHTVIMYTICMPTWQVSMHGENRETSTRSFFDLIVEKLGIRTI